MLANINRPQKFSEVVGQYQIVQNIKEQSRQEKYFSTYVFAGQFGSGKTSIARILAKAINCQNKKDGEPCGECAWCRNFMNLPDYNEVDGASNNGVDKIRELIDSVSYAPMNGKYKVYIIDEVHMLSQGAFNALLKTLEEPPAHAIFILATTESRKIPATVLSRAAVYNFQQISPTDISHRLLESSVSMTEDAAKLIARRSRGSMRDAWRILEQAAAGSTEVTADIVRELLMLNDNEVVFNSLTAVKACNIVLIAGQMQQFIRNGGSIMSLLDDMESALGDALLAVAGIEPEADESYNALICGYTADMTASDLCKLSDGIMQLEKDYRAGMTNEGVIVRLISIAQKYGSDNSQLAERVRVLEDKLNNLSSQASVRESCQEAVQIESEPEPEQTEENHEEPEVPQEEPEQAEETPEPEMPEEASMSDGFDMAGDEYDFLFGDIFSSETVQPQSVPQQAEAEKTVKEEEAVVSGSADVKTFEAALDEAMQKDEILGEAIRSNADKRIENGKIVISTPFKEIKRIIDKCIDAYRLIGINTELNK